MAGTIDQLIINRPYDEPLSHWRYERESRGFTQEPGRRPAGYVVATPGSKSFDDPGVFRELPLVNRIRPRVKAWRDSGYPGVTGTTRRLLEHRRDPELFERRRLFSASSKPWRRSSGSPKGRRAGAKGSPSLVTAAPSRGSAPRWRTSSPQALHQWAHAVTEHGGFGTWTWGVSKSPSDLQDVLRVVAS